MIDLKSDAKETIKSIEESFEKTGKLTKEQYTLYGASIAILADYKKPEKEHKKNEEVEMPIMSTTQGNLNDIHEINDIFMREIELAGRYAWLAKQEKTDIYRQMGKQSLEHAEYFLKVARGTRGINPDLIRTFQQSLDEAGEKLQSY